MGIREFENRIIHDCCNARLEYRESLTCRKCYNYLISTFVFCYSASQVNSDQVTAVMSQTVNHAISVQPNNPSWLHTLADVYLGELNTKLKIIIFRRFNVLDL